MNKDSTSVAHVQYTWDKGVAVFTGGAHNLSFSKKNLRITPDPDFRHFRNVLV